MTIPSSLLLVLFLTGAAAAEERSYTLEDAAAVALQNDSRLLSSEQDRIIAGERVREAKYLFLPEFGLQASATKFEARYPFALSQDFRSLQLFPGTPENIYSGRGYMHLSLYEGRRTINTLRLAQAAQKQANSNYDSVSMDILLAVRDSFYRLLQAQEVFESAKAAGEAVEALAGSTRLGPWERIELEGLLGGARSRTTAAQHKLDLARLRFIKTLNIEFDTPFRVTGTIEPKPVTIENRNAVLWALELRPELQSETYKAEMDAISVNLAMGRRYPTLFIAGDYELTGQRFPLKQNNWDAGIGIKIPFSYDYFTQLRQKKAEQRQGQLKRAALQDQVRLEVRQSYENLAFWQKERPLREAHYRKVQALYDEARSADGSALAKVRALVGLLDLRQAATAAAVEQVLAQAKLERAVGRQFNP